MKKLKELLPVLLPFLLVIFVYITVNSLNGNKNKTKNLKKDPMSHSEFLKNLKENKIAEVVIADNGLVKGKLKPKKTADGKDGKKQDFTANVLLHKNLIEEMEKRNLLITLEMYQLQNQVLVWGSVFSVCLIFLEQFYG